VIHPGDTVAGLVDQPSQNLHAHLVHQVRHKGEAGTVIGKKASLPDSEVLGRPRRKTLDLGLGPGGVAAGDLRVHGQPFLQPHRFPGPIRARVEHVVTVVADHVHELVCRRGGRLLLLIDDRAQIQRDHLPPVGDPGPVLRVDVAWVEVAEHPSLVEGIDEENHTRVAIDARGRFRTEELHQGGVDDRVKPLHQSVHGTVVHGTTLLDVD